MSSQDPQAWMKDYSAFLNAEENAIPQNLQTATLKKMSRYLSPSPWLVFVKLLGLHSIFGFLSLAICHQFGANPFGTSFSLSNLFMEWGGHSTCMIGCGVLFVSLSIYSSAFLLSVEEVIALKRTELLQVIFLSITSVLVFILFGAEFTLTVDGLWFVGAFVGGILSTEAMWRLKTRLA